MPGHLRVVTDDKTFLISGIPPSEGSDSAIVVVLDETERERQRARPARVRYERRPRAPDAPRIDRDRRRDAPDGCKGRSPRLATRFLDVIAREADRLTRLSARTARARASRVARRTAPARHMSRSAPILEGRSPRHLASTGGSGRSGVDPLSPLTRAIIRRIPICSSRRSQVSPRTPCSTATAGSIIDARPRSTTARS